jgi:hypothetical protein
VWKICCSPDPQNPSAPGCNVCSCDNGDAVDPPEAARHFEPQGLHKFVAEGVAVLVEDLVIVPFPIPPEHPQESKDLLLGKLRVAKRHTSSELVASMFAGFMSVYSCADG